MTFARKFLRHPRQLWIRKLNFQIHLWAGLIVALYLIVIGITGSVLVFRQEIERGRHVNSPPRVASVQAVRDNVQRAFPARPIISITTPSESDDRFLAVVQTRRGAAVVAADAGTGNVLRELARQRSWLTFVRELHITLLAGRDGRMINGIGGLVLLLLNITGLVIWWPGIWTWMRALSVDPRRSWRRINFDFHRAAGFWTLAITSFWGVSGFYFGWTRQVFAFVDRISPVVTAKPPAIRVESAGDASMPGLDSIIARAYALDPGTTLGGVAFPYNRRAPLQIFMRRRSGIAAREYIDTLYFNPFDGSCLYIWRYGANKSLGDWFIWSQVPLHYGTYWGMGVKIVWALLGLSIPLLTVTGALMYWNRFLRRKWERVRSPRLTARS